MTEWREVMPARLPVCCACPAPHSHFEQRQDGVFVCSECGNFVGYCGANGCDMGFPHNCIPKEMENLSG